MRIRLMGGVIAVAKKECVGVGQAWRRVRLASYVVVLRRVCSRAIRASRQHGSCVAVCQDHSVEIGHPHLWLELPREEEGGGPQSSQRGVTQELKGGRVLVALRVAGHLAACNIGGNLAA